jgi:BirA family biotin operon repressor/biotin-[acetyl-CoA-carboxylase] ligase
MNGKRIHLSVLESTNSYTIDLLSQNGIDSWTVVSCGHQSAGKGQRGKRWEVEPEQNLTLSIAVETQIGLGEQVVVSAAAVLGVIRALAAYGLKASFKWPNDILIHDTKVAGILIENQVSGGIIKWSVIGIGLNVNQTDFPSYPWPAGSMRNLKGGELLDKEELLTLLVKSMKQAWHELKSVSPEAAVNRLSPMLYRKGDVVPFEYAGNRYQGAVKGMAPDGGLTLQLPEGERTFYNGEIKLKRSDS